MDKYHILVPSRNQNMDHMRINQFIWRTFIWILSPNGLHICSVLYYFAKMWEYYQEDSAHS